MEDRELQELLLKNYVFINRTPCGYVWGMINNAYYTTSKKVFSKLVTDMNDSIHGNEFSIKKTKGSVVCYIVYHDKDKIMSFYKAKKKNHGIFIINDADALETIIETINS